MTAARKVQLIPADTARREKPSRAMPRQATSCQVMPAEARIIAHAEAVLLRALVRLVGAGSDQGQSERETAGTTRRAGSGRVAEADIQAAAESTQALESN